MDNGCLERFLNKMSPEPNSGCWLWEATINNKGYGQLFFGGKLKYAHRLAYEHYIGPIPIGKQIDHKCRTRSCVNPWHMRVVSQIENLRAPGSKWLAIQKTCKRGHLYSADNIYRRPKTGYGMCRECCQIREKSRPKRKKRSD